MDTGKRVNERDKVRGPGVLGSCRRGIEKSDR